MSSSDFFWGTIVGGNIEAANRHTANAVGNLQEAARIREQGARDVAREKSLQESFDLGRKKMAELRELLREAHGARDTARAGKSAWNTRFSLLESEFKKLHPDPEAAETIIQDIHQQGRERYIQILEEKGYEVVGK